MSQPARCFYKICLSFSHTQTSSNTDFQASPNSSLFQSPAFYHFEVQTWRSTLLSCRCQVASFVLQFEHVCSIFFNLPTQNGIQPRQRVAQRPAAQTLTTHDQYWYLSERTSWADSQCVIAWHVFYFAYCLLLANGALNRDGDLAERSFVRDFLLRSSWVGLSVLHRGSHCAGSHFGIWYLRRWRGRGKAV